jgi:hypothetical protein
LVPVIKEAFLCGYVQVRFDDGTPLRSAAVVAVLPTILRRRMSAGSRLGLQECCSR